MAAYYKVEVSLNTNSVTVGSPSAQEVLVTLPLVGPAGATGPQGPAGAGAVESVNAQTGVVVLNASDVQAIATSVLTTQGDIVVRGASAPQRLALGNGLGKPLVVGASGPEWSVADSNYVVSQSVKISGAGTAEVNGVYLPTDSINGKASYIKDEFTISWDGTSWNISADTTDYYTSSNDTSYPWQATTWTVDSGDSPHPDVEQAALSDMEAVLGSKSYNTRTPSSTLAHAASHHTGGSDPLPYPEILASPSGVDKFKLGLGGDSPTGRFVGVTTATDPLIGILSYTDENSYDPDAEVSSSEFGMTLGANATNLFAQYLKNGGLEHAYDFPSDSGTLALNETFAAPPAIGNTTPNTLAGTELALHDGSDTGTFVAASKLTANRTYDLPDRSGTMVVSDTSAGTGSDVVNNIVSLTQAEYNAIGSPDSATLFLITDP